MTLLHPVSDRLLVMGKAVLVLSGFVCMALGSEAVAQHRHVSAKAHHHRKKPLARPVGKHGAQKHAVKHLKTHNATKSVVKSASQAPLAAGAFAAGGAATAASAAALAKPALPEPEKGTDTGYPIPRFASLRADRVYMRRGPGERYPIDWVYHRRGLPVKIEREFDVWRLVEDSEGQKGWVHRVTLRGTRTFVVPGPASNGTSETGKTLAAKPDTKISFSKHADPRVIAYVAPQELSHQKGDHIYLLSSTGADRKVVALLKPGVVGQIMACPAGSAWCHVKVTAYEGWVQRQSLWGLFPEETIQSK